MNKYPTKFLKKAQIFLNKGINSILEIIFNQEQKL